MVERAAAVIIAAIAVTAAGCSGVSQLSAPPAAVAPRATVYAAQPGDCHGVYRSYMVRGRRYWVETVAAGHWETGTASWYGRRFHGRKTASGEIFDMHQMSAAHKTLPLLSIVRVINLDNGREVTVRVNDRGPFAGERLIDLSYAAAQALGMTHVGLAPVRVIVARTPSDNRHAALPDLIRLN